ncbi:hypothetical protein [Nocardia sp. NPDC052566]|uniref:hypothetical protein n=1 Tax=Nocardia sp. NPDC052566 TaxID=3364330 RepID=UPI0037C689C0
MTHGPDYRKGPPRRRLSWLHVSRTADVLGILGLVISVIAAIAGLLFVNRDRGDNSAKALPATTFAASVTTTVGRPSETTSSATSSTTTTRTTAKAATVIQNVEIETMTYGFQRIGPDRYKLQCGQFDCSDPTVSVYYGWTSYVNGSGFSNHECTVTATVTGPSITTRTYHADSCSEVAGRGEGILIRQPGEFTVTVEVVPDPGRGTPITVTKIFTVTPPDR